ncbi:hypothetical protein MO973_09655 [Paenibacillus sp. TRM 82003]|uniref:hypothetical protein n=1 Tax=Kineococcus sp. TRM81007 TaxID=2925831 RepID=UPI001F5850B0|nr:hypothetical protein [Kineococcus sp. TRM81007]MCI2238112.1 hypothetical protein [Kineococcus sp. TRM81007]MCI3920496.1 hypothetical protein [Paenibacillus sp. TRM 82003]
MASAPEYQATTVQACGLFPFVAGSGSPSVGVPVGRHMMWGEVVCMDPFAWLDAGLVTNRGLTVLGQPGTGKSAMLKRLSRGMLAFGVRPLFLGDLKPDYSSVVTAAGGQVLRVGRGLDRINPLDAGPLGAALTRLSGSAAQRLRLEVRGRRLSATLALCSLVRRHDRVNNGEETVLGAAVDLLTDRLPDGVDPTIPDVLCVIRESPDRLVAAAEVDDGPAYRAETKELRQTLNLLCEGSLKGVFDGPTSRPIDLDAPAVSVDISAVAASGDTLVAAAMLSTWSYGFAVIDASTALAEAGLAPRRRYFAVMDELWRALRGAPGLVDHADALTRVYRGRDVAHAMATHSLDDLAALPSEEDRSKARGFIERNAITVLAGLPPRELEEVTRVVSLSSREVSMVSSWSAPESWQTGARHPGRGKYLLKTGQRVGIPVEMELVGNEPALYDTDSSHRAVVQREEEA